MKIKYRTDMIKVLVVLSVLLQVIIVVLLAIDIFAQNDINPSNEVSYLIVNIVDDNGEHISTDIDTILINSGHINISLDKVGYNKITGKTIGNINITEDEILGLYLDYFGVFGWKLLLKEQNTLFFSKQYT